MLWIATSEELCNLYLTVDGIFIFSVMKMRLLWIVPAPLMNVRIVLQQNKS